MSKIQKALGRIRVDGSPAGDAESNDQSKTTEQVKVRRRREKATGNRRFNVSDEMLLGEIQPKVRIHVDNERLKEFGFCFSETDTEVLGQQFRRIKRPILNIGFGRLSADVENSNVVMVASALPKSGKTFCSYNLALSIARERDIGAVLVDADVLKANTSRAFGIQDRVGLIDFLLESSITLDDIIVGTDLHDIVFVPAGRRHEEATELLASRRMKQFVHELSERFPARAIIVDTPPLLITNEANVLAEHMGQIVFVIEVGITSQEAVKRALESFNHGIPINAVVNKVRGSSGTGYAGDYSGIYYGYDPEREDQDE